MRIRRVHTHANLGIRACACVNFTQTSLCLRKRIGITHANVEQNAHAQENTTFTCIVTHMRYFYSHAKLVICACTCVDFTHASPFLRKRWCVTTHASYKTTPACIVIRMRYNETNTNINFFSHTRVLHTPLLFYWR